jgi:virulence-associated protein VapD
MFKIVLTNNIEDAELTFKVRETAIAQKWFSELCKNYSIYEDDRFSNWHAGHQLIDELNQQIDIINRYENIIDRTASGTTTQDDLNYLHKFFEDLRGEVIQGTPWFHKAPDNVKIALERLNILIHLFEEQLRSPNYPTLVVTFNERERHLLTEDDMKHFTFHWKKGTVYINYCHVGKPILDVFKDQDKITEGVRPQTHYSADFMIKFGPSTNYCLFMLRKLIINVWLRFQKFKFKNPNIGYIPVADIVSDFNIEDYRKFNKVKNVLCLK